MSTYINADFEEIENILWDGQKSSFIGSWVSLSHTHILKNMVLFQYMVKKKLAALMVLLILQNVWSCLVMNMYLDPDRSRTNLLRNTSNSNVPKRPMNRQGSKLRNGL